MSMMTMMTMMMMMMMMVMDLRITEYLHEFVNMICNKYICKHDIAVIPKHATL